MLSVNPTQGKFCGPECQKYLTMYQDIKDMVDYSGVSMVNHVNMLNIYAVITNCSVGNRPEIQYWYLAAYHRSLADINKYFVDLSAKNP